MAIVKELLNELYYNSLLSNREEVVSKIVDIIDRLDLVNHEEKNNFLAEFLMSIKQEADKDDEKYGFLSLSLVEQLIQRNYEFDSFNDVVVPFFRTKHNNVRHKITDIIELRQLSTEEECALLSSAISCFNLKSDKEISIMEFAQLFSIIPNACERHLEENKGMPENMLWFCLSEEGEDSKICLYYLCKLFQSITINLVISIFTNKSLKDLSNYTPSLLYVFSNLERSDISSQYIKALKDSIKELIKRIIAKASFKNAENVLFGLAAELFKFTDNLDALLYETFLNKLLTNYYSIDCFTIISMMYKNCEEFSTIKQFIPEIWLKFVEVIGKQVDVISSDLLIGLSFCIEYCYQNVKDIIQEVIYFYVARPNIGDNFMKIIEELTQYDFSEFSLKDELFIKLSEYITNSSYEIVNNTIVEKKRTIMSPKRNYTFDYYLDLFFEMNFAYKGILQYLRSNILQCFSNKDQSIRNASLKIVMQEMINIPDRELFANTLIIKETMDYIIEESNDTILVFAYEELCNCKSIHFFLYEYYLDLILASLVENTCELKVKIIKLVGKLLKFDTTFAFISQYKTMLNTIFNQIICKRCDCTHFEESLILIRASMQYCPEFIKPEQNIIFALENIDYKTHGEEDNILLLQCYKEFTEEYGFDLMDCQTINYLTELISFFLDEDIIEINILVLQLIQELVLSCGVSSPLYILIPNLLNKLINIIRNSKKEELKKEAIETLISCGPINYNTNLELIDKCVFKVIEENTGSLRKEILAKYSKKIIDESELLSHGKIYFDKINGRITDFENVIYQKDQEEITHISYLDSILKTVLSSLHSDEVNVQYEAVNAFKEICKYAEIDGMRLNILPHIFRICYNISNLLDEQQIIKELDQLIYIIKYASYCTPTIEETVIDMLFEIQSNDTLSEVLSLIEEMQMQLISEDELLSIYKNDEITNLLLQLLRESPDQLIISRCLRDILLFRKDFISKQYVLIPVILQEQKQQQSLKLQLLAIEILTKFITTTCNCEMINYIYMQEYYLLDMQEDKNYKHYVIIILVVCCIMNPKETQYIIEHEYEFKSISPMLYNFVISLHLIEERKVVFQTSELLFLFDSYQQQCMEDEKLQWFEIFKKCSKEIVNFPHGSSSEHLLNIMSEYTNSHFNQIIDMDYEYGSDNIEEPLFKCNDLYFNLQEVGEYKSQEEWENWFSKYIYHSIRMSECKYISICSQLAEVDQTNEELLFNNSMLYFVKETNRKESNISTLETILLKVLHRSTPSNIQLFFVNLVDFLNQNGIPMNNLINEDALFDISDEFQAYTRNIRIREQQCNLLVENNYLDSLFECYNEISQIEMAEELLTIEEQILDRNYLFYIYYCFSNLLSNLESNQYESCNQIIDEINSYQMPLISSLSNLYNENSMLYFENLFVTVETSFDVKYTCDSLISTIKLIVTQFCEKFNFITQANINEINNAIINELIYKNSEQYEIHFNAKPQWLISAGKFFEAIQIIEEEIDAVDNYLLTINNEIKDENFKDTIQQHYSLYIQLINTLFLASKNKKIIEYVEKYREKIRLFKFWDSQKEEKEYEKFCSNISHIMLELVDTKEEQLYWIAYLPKEHLLIKLYYLALLEINNEHYQKSQEYLDKLNSLIYPSIITTMQENYHRSYDYLIILLQAYDIELAINRQTNEEWHLDNVENIINAVRERLMNLNPKLEYWKDIIHTLTITFPQALSEDVYIQYVLLCIKKHKLTLAKDILKNILVETPPICFRIHKNTAEQYYLQSDNYDFAVPKISSHKTSAIYAYAQSLLQDQRIDMQIAGFVYMLRLFFDEATEPVFLSQLVLKLIYYLDYYTYQKHDYQLQDDNEFTSLVNQSVLNAVDSASASYTSDLPESSEITSSSSYSRADYQNAYPDKASLVSFVILDITSRFTRLHAESKVQQQLFLLERAALLAQNNEDIQFTTAQISYGLYESDAESPATISFSQYASSGSAAQPAEQSDAKLQYLHKALQFYFSCQKYQIYQIQSSIMILKIIGETALNQQCENLIYSSIEHSKADYWLSCIYEIITLAGKPNFKYRNVLLQIILTLSIHYYELVLPQVIVACYTENEDIEEDFAKIVDITIRNEKDDQIIELIEFNRELDRISQSLSERTYDKLQECITLLNSEDNDKQNQFVSIFANLYQCLEESSDDYLSIKFKILIEGKLKEAFEMLKCALVKQSKSLLSDVKSQLIDISCRIQDQISDINYISLTDISSRLLNLYNSNIVLHGSKQPEIETYNSENIYITKIIPRLNIIESKQRPRKMAVVASDGEVYAYLLKGKEDLRQDERVMQYLRFIDFLMKKEQYYQIKLSAYPVIPLTNYSGLIFWVPNTNSLQNLIQSEKSKINDYDLQMQFRAAHYSILSLPQRIDAMKYALKEIPSNALNEAIFSLSTSSENYIESRTTYTETLAAFSIAGHIIGLGDRHPGNILLNSEMQVVNIDYGDCFEMAMKRDKYPEKTVFRLTKMMENAMDICGKDGIFKLWFIKILEVLRNNTYFIQGIFKGYLKDIDFDVLNKKLIGIEKIPIDTQMSVEEEAEYLINSASSIENLAQAYYGWAPFL